jgi:hypothetical protein
MWRRNELRAALSVDNMVALCYIYDPTHSPYDHRDAAQQLKQSFGPDLVCAVFELSGRGKVDGRLLTADVGEGEGGGQRLVTYEEFLERSNHHEGKEEAVQATASAYAVGERDCTDPVMRTVRVLCTCLGYIHMILARDAALHLSIPSVRELRSDVAFIKHVF